MANTTPVHPEQHAKLKVKERVDYTILARQQFAPLTAHEFSQAASSYPIIMLKDGQTGRFVSVAFWGFEADQNILFNSLDSSWDAVHLPNDTQCQPFLLGPASNEANTLTMHINQDSELVQETEGHALFDSNGETAFLKSMQAKLSEHYQNQVYTRDFINLLLEHNLLKEIEMIVAYQDERIKRVKGLYTIDEEALSKLDEATIVDFFKRNLFIPIYAMLNSLTQFNRLMKVNNKNGQYPGITRLQMKTPSND